MFIFISLGFFATRQVSWGMGGGGRLLYFLFSLMITHIRKKKEREKKKNLYMCKEENKVVEEKGWGEIKRFEPQIVSSTEDLPPPIPAAFFFNTAFILENKTGSNVGKRQERVESLLPDGHILQSPPTLHTHKFPCPGIFSYMMAKKIIVGAQQSTSPYIGASLPLSLSSLKGVYLAGDALTGFCIHK